MTSLQQFYGLSNMMIPKDGPRTVPANLEFDDTGTISIDGLLVSTVGVIEFIQGVYVDNFDNDLEFSITSGTTNQRVICPPNSGGYFNLLIPNPPSMTARLDGASGGERVKCYFYNVPIQSGVWNRTGGGGGGGGSVDIASIGGENYFLSNFMPARLSGGEMVDWSLDNPTGGNDEILPAGRGLYYVRISNPTGNADIVVNLAGGDATARGLTLAAGEYVELQGGTSGAVTVAGTVGEQIICFASGEF